MDNILVGMGVTKLCWTDRLPFTVVEVVSSTRIVVQQDKVHRSDGTDNYEPDPTAERVTLTLRKDGKWHGRGMDMRSEPYAVGFREYYYDPSF